MGILLSALAAAGNSGVDSMNRDQEQMNKFALENQRNENAMRSQLAMDKQRSVLEQQKAQFLSELQNAPSNRAGAIMREVAGQELPVTALPVTQLSGNDPNSEYQSQKYPENNTGKGLVGMTRDQVKAYNDPDMLAQYDRQLASDNQSAQDAVAGQTRKRTSSEIFSDTYNKLIASGDIDGAAAIEKYTHSKNIVIKDGDTVLDANGKPIFINNAKQNLEEMKEEGRNRRAKDDREASEAAASKRSQDALDRDASKPQLVETEDGLVMVTRPKFNGDSPTVTPVMGEDGKQIMKKKNLPRFVIEGINENAKTSSVISEALEALDTESGKNAVGTKGILPNFILNRVDPDGTTVRADIADIGSLVIHDRSGAAVTASESERLKPFIPLPTDDYDTVVKKLTRMKKIADDESEKLVFAYPGAKSLADFAVKKETKKSATTPTATADGWSNFRVN